MKFWTAGVLALALCGMCRSGFAQQADSMESWLEGFLPQASITSSTCITGLKFPPVSFADSEAKHQLIVYYIQDGRPLMKPYPEYSTFPTGTEGWGYAARAALENYRSHPGYQSRSCEVARSWFARLHRTVQEYNPMGGPAEAAH